MSFPLTATKTTSIIRRAKVLGERLLLVAVPAAAIFFASAPAFAEPLRVSIQPTRLEVEVAPGERFESGVNFWNGTDAFLSVHLHGEDFSPQGEKGELKVGGPEAAANSLKTWLIPAIPDLSVAPQEEIRLDFAIDVPTDAEPGTHWGTLVVTTDPMAIDRGVATRPNIGLIILVKVPGDVREEMALESFSVERFAEKPPVALAARFRNTGTVHEAPQGLLEVRNVFGSLVATGTLPMQNVLPGTVRRIETQAGAGAWFGRYTATLRTTYAGGRELPEARVTFWMIPWKTYGPWFFGALIGLAFISFEPRRLLLALRILVTGRSPQRKPGEASNQPNQTP